MLTIVEFLKNVGVGLGVICLIILAAVAILSGGQFITDHAVTAMPIVAPILLVVFAWAIGSGLRS